MPLHEREVLLLFGGSSAARASESTCNPGVTPADLLCARIPVVSGHTALEDHGFGHPATYSRECLLDAVIPITAGNPADR